MIFKSTKQQLNHYNIPPTDENHELLRKAKAAIAKSHPDQALELLSTLKLKTLDIEITTLSSRLADLERTQSFGTESFDTETREYNKIKKSILFLITALEKEIAQSFEFYDKIRAALKSRYETRLSQKLSNRQPVNLRLIPSTVGTTPQAANTFVQYSEGEIREKLAEYYKDAHSRLLLVGVPGAGKTTLLLQLELELLAQETTRIPVILNLARWSSTFPTLEAWIQEILPSEMELTLNKKMATDLIVQNRLILLMDGLDEVKPEDRQTCLEAIGAYGEDASRYFILSSRIEEYKAAAKDAPVNGQVEVGLLTYEQLVEQLEKAEQNEGSKRLLTSLKEDVILREIAEVPFYFNTLQLLFARGKYLHEFNFAAIDTDGRKKEIERSFVSEMFQKINTKGYDAQSITKYLGFFASRLKRANLVDFELSDLQYDWHKISKLDNVICIFLSVLVHSLAFWTIIGFVLSCILGNTSGIIIALFFCLFSPSYSSFCFVLGLDINIIPFVKITGLTFKNSIPRISTRENITWKWGVLISNIFESVFLMAIVFIFFRVLGDRSLDAYTQLIYSLAFGIGLGMVKFFINNNSSLIQTNKPYQRFAASWLFLHFSIIQHWHLRYTLWRKSLLPFKLVHFLNDMVKCNILETTGASWRFRHRILQDYFADQWVETEFEPEQK